MAGRCSLEIKDENGEVIEMEQAIEGRHAEVYQFKFGVNVSVDNISGKLTGTRQYQPLTITKPICKASPILFRKLCEGKKLEEAILTVYRHDPDEGDEKPFYQITLKQVSLIGITPLVRDTTVESARHVPPLEDVELIGESVTMCIVDGNIEYTDYYKTRSGLAA